MDYFLKLRMKRAKYVGKKQQERKIKMETKKAIANIKKRIIETTKNGGNSCKVRFYGEVDLSVIQNYIVSNNMKYTLEKLLYSNDYCMTITWK